MQATTNERGYMKRLLLLTMVFVLSLALTVPALAAVRDTDKDGIRNSLDNCPNVANRAQTDTDKQYDNDFASNGLTKGDACDPDNDTPPPPPPPPPTSDPANVCAHWHVAAQRGVSGIDTPEELQPQFQAAREAGVECFALNVNGWDASYQFNTNLVWDAATQWNAAHPGYQIYLYPSVDMASISSESTFEQISRYKYNDPARLRVGGGRFGNNLPVTQTWQGQSLFGGPSGWNRVLTEEKNAGFPVFFMPYFYEGAYGGLPQLVDAFNGANNADPSDDVVDGLYNFGGFASGDNTTAGTQENQNLRAAVTPGMDAQVGCAPHFNRHSDTGQFGNRILGDFEGFNAFNTCMQDYATHSDRFMEFTTWNDYLEGSYLGVNYTQDQLPSTWDGNYLSHDAFRPVSKYYVQWRESGQKPTTTTDFIALAHRPHFENSPGINANGAGILDDTDSIGLRRQTDYSVVEDRLYVLSNLKTGSNGMLLINTGNMSYTATVPDGVFVTSVPMNTGVQSVELWRGETMVMKATSPVSVTNSPVSLFNYNVTTSFAQGV